MGIFFHAIYQFGHDRNAILILNAFRNSNYTTANPVIGLFDIQQELFNVKSAFRQINQMRPVRWIFLGNRCSSRQKPGMPAHDHTDVDSRQRPIIQVGANKRLRHKPRGRTVTWCMVVQNQIIINGFGDVNGTEIILGTFRLFIDNADRIRRIIAADIKEISDVMRPHHFKHRMTVFFIRFIPCR